MQPNDTNPPSTPIPQPIPLGKNSEYPDRYDPGLLFPIARKDARQAIGIDSSALPFMGWDLWRAYEVSWLTLSGLPQVAILKVWIDCNSPNIVESKSFKLYLNSLNQEKFSNAQSVVQRIQADVSQAAGLPIRIELVPAMDFANERIHEPGEVCIDNQSIEVDTYEPDASLLEGATGSNVVKETLVTHLLKSNCPVTNQPDWASLHISYHGPEIDRAALLRYVVSYRNHQGFHEQCVERIFVDLMTHCAPQSLSVYARYTRRGGLDINPWRATAGFVEPTSRRGARQ
jgi:7-cyano-7-deazaguanine reductase